MFLYQKNQHSPYGHTHYFPEDIEILRLNRFEKKHAIC